MENATIYVNNLEDMETHLYFLDLWKVCCIPIIFIRPMYHPDTLVNLHAKNRIYQFLLMLYIDISISIMVLRLHNVL